jgi:hypothetical protein
MCKRCPLCAANAVYSNCPTSKPDLHDAGRTILGIAASYSIPWRQLCQNRVHPTTFVASTVLAKCRSLANYLGNLFAKPHFVTSVVAGHVVARRLVQIADLR